MTGEMVENKGRKFQVPQKHIPLSRIACVSDMHNQFSRISIPKCDILLVAGDITNQGEYDEIVNFNNTCFHLLKNNVVGQVVVIAGNHDLTAQRDPETWKKLLPDVTYLCDEEVTIRGLRIYGSPWQPSFGKQYWVFNADRGREIREKWDKIPEGLDILITHGPAYGAGDMTDRGERVGCWDLRESILAKKPRVHVCGHIHYGYGMSLLGNTTVLNAASCDERYKPVNSPLVIDL